MYTEATEMSGRVNTNLSQILAVEIQVTALRHSCQQENLRLCLETNTLTLLRLKEA